MAITDIKQFERFIEGHPLGKNHPLFIAWAYGGKSFEEMVALGDFNNINQQVAGRDPYQDIEKGDMPPDFIENDTFTETNVKVTDIDNNLWTEGSRIGRFKNIGTRTEGVIGSFKPVKWYKLRSNI